MDARSKLIAKVRSQAANELGVPFVSLEDFFVGNDDWGSIGCNLLNSPGPQGFLGVLRAIRDRPEVRDVLVGIREIEQDASETWPFSDMIHVIADASLGEIREWLALLEPDEIYPRPAPTLSQGSNIFAAWWD